MPDMSRFVKGPSIGARTKADPSAAPGATPLPSPTTGRVDQVPVFVHCTPADVAVFEVPPIDPAVPTEPLIGIHVFAVPSADGVTSAIRADADSAWFFSSSAPHGVWTPAAPPAVVVPPLADGQVAILVPGVPFGRSDWEPFYEYAE
jgi:hypothetical protein